VLVLQTGRCVQLLRWGCVAHEARLTAATQGVAASLDLGHNDLQQRSVERHQNCPQRELAGPHSPLAPGCYGVDAGARLMHHLQLFTCGGVGVPLNVTTSMFGRMRCFAWCVWYLAT
jgi:hypothetical protein